MQTTTHPDAASEVKFSAEVSRGFTQWLKSKNISLVLSTYKVGKVIFLGVDPQNELWIYNRNVGRCLGLKADATGFWVSSDSWLYRFENTMPAQRKGTKGEDALYSPRQGYFTGDMDIHDIAVTPDNEPLFVNTMCNCLAKPSWKSSFEMVWKPPFITDLIAEDRCHLNGLAMKDGKPAYMTAVSTSNTFDGWRDQRESGGVLLEVKSGKVLCSGLSMPHSPRWYKGKLWLHNSGHGEFGYINFSKKKFEPVAFCPGYLRGLDFVDDYAVVGLSLPRENSSFTGLPLDTALTERKIQAKCGLYIVELKSGRILHSVKFGGVVSELYDVAVLPGVRQPAALSPFSETLKNTLFIPG